METYFYNKGTISLINVRHLFVNDWSLAGLFLTVNVAQDVNNGCTVIFVQC